MKGIKSQRSRVRPEHRSPKLAGTFADLLLHMIGQSA